MDNHLKSHLSRVFFILFSVFAGLIATACSKEEPLQAMGLLEWDRIELVAENNEPIIEIIAYEGQTLQAGDIILMQDNRRIQAQLDEAMATTRQSQARLAELERGPRAERIDEARARLSGLQSEAENALKELARLQKLITQKLISPEALDTARAQYQKATADKNGANAALQELLNGATPEELQQAEAAVAQASARANALQITLDNLTLRAPRKGLLDSLPYKAGERPATGSVIAVILADTRPYARVYVPEPLRAQVKQNSLANIYIDGLPQIFPGRVRRISSEAVFTPYYSLTERDRSRLSYLAEVELIQEEGTLQLPSGIPVRVDFVPGNP